MRYVAALLAIGLTLLAWGQHRLLTQYTDLADGLIPLAAGLLAVSAAVGGRAFPDDEPPGSTASDPPATARPRWRSVALIAISAALVAWVGVQALATERDSPGGWHLALWAAGIAAFIGGTIQPGELRDRRGGLRRWLAEGPGPGHAAIIGAVTVLALVVRVALLEDHPRPFSFDEAAFAQEAAAIAEGTFTASPFGPAWLSHPRLFHYILAIPIGLLGRTVTAARLFPAVMGALTVPAVYALGRELFGRRVGLAAALFMTGFGLHLHFSRLALNNIVDPLFGTLAFVFLARALRSRRLSDYGLAGLALGASQYFYAGARLLPVIMLAWGVVLAVHAAARRRAAVPSDIRHTLIGIGLLALGALVITWPRDWFSLAGGYPLTTRLSDTGLFQTGRFAFMRQSQSAAAIALWQLKWAWLALIHTRDNSMFYGPVAPVMGRYAGVILLVGMVVAAGRLRRPAYWLPLLWIAATVTAGGALLVEPPHYARYVLLTPAAALLVGLGVVAIFDVLARRSALRPAFRRWFPAAVGAGLMAVEIAFYFGVYLPHPQSYARDGHTPQGEAIALYLRGEAASHPRLRVYYVTAPHLFLDNATLISYFAPGLDDFELIEPLHTLPPWIDPQADNLFIFTPERAAESLAAIEGLPGGQLMTFTNGQGRPLFHTYRAIPRAGQ